MDKTYIECIGIDRKVHIREPHKNICKCGMEVKRKKILKNDINMYYWCYECSY
jgi:hypothetical protein